MNSVIAFTASFTSKEDRPGKKLCEVKNTEKAITPESIPQRQFLLYFESSFIADSTE